MANNCAAYRRWRCPETLKYDAYMFDGLAHITSLVSEIVSTEVAFLTINFNLISYSARIFSRPSYLIEKLKGEPFYCLPWKLVLI